MASWLHKTLAVVGAGQMGSGIAQVAAMRGMQVQLTDTSRPALEKAVSNLRRALERLVSKQQLSAGEAEAALGRVQTADSLQATSSADVIVEAATENLALKQSIFQQLDQVAAPHSILASNTSSISITRLAAATQRPQQVVGMHFMNPVPLMQLVELIRGMATSDETFQSTCSLAEHLGKKVCIAEDRPGFIVNRVLMPMINEAFFALMEGVGTADDIDRGMKLGTNQPMGPLQLADFIGLDTCLSIMRVLYEGMADSKYRPCPLLVQYVDAGWLGKKTGKGVYKYEQ